MLLVFLLTGAATFTINGETYEPKDEDGVNGKVYAKADLETKPFPEDVDPKMREVCNLLCSACVLVLLTFENFTGLPFNG